MGLCLFIMLDKLYYEERFTNAYKDQSTTVIHFAKRKKVKSISIKIKENEKALEPKAKKLRIESVTPTSTAQEVSAPTIRPTPPLPTKKLPASINIDVVRNADLPGNVLNSSSMF